MWQVRDDSHADGCLSVFGADDEVPVVVARAGRYPQAVSPDGKTTAAVPHVLISIYHGYDGGSHYFNGVVVDAVGELAGGRRRAIRVYSDVDHGGARSTSAPDAWVEAGLAWVEAARRELAGMDERYAAAEQVVGRARAYARPLSRGEYEAACATCAVAPLSDDECMGYGVRYGDFSFPEYSAEYVLTMRLARLRQQRLDAERDAPMPAPAPPTTVPGKSGQLWEPCERCGRELVYMPLHLCGTCWPRGAAA